MPDLVRLLFDVPWGSPSGLEILHGIRDFMRLRSQWTMRVSGERIGQKVEDADAIILTTGYPDLKKHFERFKGPVVSVVDDEQADLRIIVDDARIGELAALHLHERGYHHFVFAGNHPTHLDGGYREKRYTGFAHAVAGVHGSLTVVNDIARTPSSRAADSAWLRNLPRPCGVFCPDDQSALIILDCCRFAGIPVPEEIAVVGADNEAIWCETSLPPLSSVAIPWRQVGVETATWIERLLNGQRPPKNRRIMLVPEMVVSRQSTDSIALSHPTMVSALEYIRAHAFTGIAVKAVERAVGVNRRQLDRLFQRYLGRTPYEEIRRIQIDKAKELLACTDLSIREICAATGLSPDYFATNFRKMVGISAIEFSLEHGRRR